MALQSFYGQFLLALQAYLNTEVPEIRYIDRDLAQLDIGPDDLGRYPVSFPCLIIDFTDAVYDQLGNQVQTGTPTLLCRLAAAPFSTSNSLAPTAVREKALKFWELEQKLYVALQGWDAGGLCQPLTRFRAASEQREDTIAVRQVYFNTFFHDETAAPEMQTAPRPALEVEGVLSLPGA